MGRKSTVSRLPVEIKTYIEAMLATGGQTLDELITDLQVRWPAQAHAGDLPSLKADANGVADLKFMMVGPTIPAGPTSLVGRAVIVHAQPDDYATQPTGNSGARIACGVIAGH